MSSTFFEQTQESPKKRGRAYYKFFFWSAWLLALAALVLVSFQVWLFAAVSPLIAITLLPSWVLLPLFVAWQTPVNHPTGTLQTGLLRRFLSKMSVKVSVGIAWFVLACCSLAFLISLQKSPDAAWIQTLSTIISPPNATYLAVSILFVVPLSTLFLKTVMSWIQGETTFLPSAQPTVYDDISEAPKDDVSWKHMNFYWERKAGIYQPIWCHDTWEVRRPTLSILAFVFLVGIFVFSVHETILIALNKTPWLSDLFRFPQLPWTIAVVSGCTIIARTFRMLYLLRNEPDRIQPNIDQLKKIQMFTQTGDAECLLQYRARVLLKNIFDILKLLKVEVEKIEVGSYPSVLMEIKSQKEALKTKLKSLQEYDPFYPDIIKLLTQILNLLEEERVKNSLNAHILKNECSLIGIIKYKDTFQKDINKKGDTFKNYDRFGYTDDDDTADSSIDPEGLLVRALTDLKGKTYYWKIQNIHDNNKLHILLKLSKISEILDDEKRDSDDEEIQLHGLINKCLLENSHYEPPYDDLEDEKTEQLNGLIDEYLTDLKDEETEQLDGLIATGPSKSNYYGSHCDDSDSDLSFSARERSSSRPI